MGFLQDKPAATKEEVWGNATNMGDYPGARARPDYLDADYVFGRMLKLRVSRPSPDSLDIPDYKPHYDYQAWCDVYKTYAALFDAAEHATEKQKAA